MRKRLATCGIIACCLALAMALAGCAQQPQPQAKAPESSSSQETESTAAASYSNDPFYVLVVGDDSRVGTVEENSGSDHSKPPFRSDTMMLVRVDPTTHLFTVVSIPRDTKVDIDGEPVKLNEYYRRLGNEGLVQKVSEMAGVPIRYYLDTTFVGFENLVDGIGGVDVNVPIAISLKDIVHGDYISLDAGDQHLNGPQALVLARVRKAYVDMDSTRQYNDRAVLISLIQKALDNPAEASDYATVLFNTLNDTNMPADELAYYMSDFIGHASQVTFLSGSMPADGGIDEETGIWFAYYDPDMWASIMSVVEGGGDPNDVYTPPFG